MTDLDCLRSAVRIYRAVERVGPARARRTVNRFLVAERMAALRGLELIELAMCRALRAARWCHADAGVASGFVRRSGVSGRGPV